MEHTDAAQFSVAARPDTDVVAPDARALRGNLSTIQLLFTILAFNGPLTVVVGFAPVIVGYGNGIGAPMAYVGAGVLIAFFTAGFIKMSKDVKNPGGFYSFVSMGLGREAGLGASFLAIACYYLLNLGCYAFIGITINPVVHGLFGGPELDWWIWALIAQALVGTLCYFNLELSARLLTFLLAGELVILAVYDFAVTVQGGADGLSAQPLLPEHAFSGAVGLALLFGVMGMGGFEVTAIFRDEVRDPDRTIPRAAYGFTAFVTVLFGFSTWALVESLGEHDAVAATSGDPTAAFLSTMDAFVGRFGVDLVTVLVNTSVIAATIATQNVLSRYLFNLGCDGVLPRSIGTPHEKHGSPSRASVICTAAIFVGFLPFVIFGADPAVLYAQLTGGFGYALLVLLTLTSAAVFVYFNFGSGKRRPASRWHRQVAPLTACIAFGLVVVLASQNIDLLITHGPGLIALMLGGIYGAFVIGFVYARVLRATKPDVYARIGRQ